MCCRLSVHAPLHCTAEQCFPSAENVASGCATEGLVGRCQIGTVCFTGQADTFLHVSDPPRLVFLASLFVQGLRRSRASAYPVVFGKLFLLRFLLGLKPLELLFVKLMTYVSCEYGHLNGSNSTLQASCVMRQELQRWAAKSKFTFEVRQSPSTSRRDSVMDSRVRFIFKYRVPTYGVEG